MPPVRTHTSKPTPLQTDAILPLQEPYMTQILSGQKTYEFRKYLIKPSVKRIWFYITAPSSCIKYVCEISPARTRNSGDEPLEEGGVGNVEFNEGHVDWVGYDFAYKILSVYEIGTPISLGDMKLKYGMKGVPRGLVYVNESIKSDVVWDRQNKLR